MKTHHPFQFLLELRKGDGSFLGQAPVAADWEPAVEAARFGAMRRFGLAAIGADACAEVLPIWDPGLGPPYVLSTEVRVRVPGWGEHHCRIPNRFFRGVAGEVMARLVREGRAPKGFDFEYRVQAVPKPGDATPAPAMPRARFELEETVVPLPLESTSLELFRGRAVMLGPSEAGDMPVFLPEELLEESDRLARDARGVEAASVLVGRIHRDPQMGTLFLEATAQIAACDPGTTATSVTFGPETWTAVHAALALRRRGEVPLGWFHSHPGAHWCNKACPPEDRARCPLQQPFFSEDDCLVHRTAFPKAFHVALLATETDAGIRRNLFGWRDGILVERGFHLLDPSPEFPVLPPRADSGAPATPALIGEPDHGKSCPG
jgi:proteasome lid subunit RPN8/RPN11